MLARAIVFKVDRVRTTRFQSSKWTMSPSKDPILSFKTNLLGFLGPHLVLEKAILFKVDQSSKLTMSPSKDPILTAFELSWELRQLAFSEFEFKSEYLVRIPFSYLVRICCIPGQNFCCCSLAKIPFSSWREFSISSTCPCFFLSLAFLCCKVNSSTSYPLFPVM